METIENKLQACCNLIDSAKVTERKKHLEELKHLLKNERFVQLLHDNTEENRFPVWNTLFQAVHRALLKEGERYLEEETKRKSTAACDNSKAICISNISTIVRLANQDSLRLNCKDIISSALEVLESQRFRKQFAELYINLLVFHVLPKPEYWFDITFDYWSDLLTLFEQIYRECTTDKLKSATLSALNLIILHGSNVSHLTLKLKQKFKFLLDICSSGGGGRLSALQASVLELSLTMCRQLSKESRFLICKFGEDILPTVIRMYESRAEDVYNKKEKLLELLLFLVSVHCPCGADSCSPISLANNWAVWHKHMQSIYLMLQHEVSLFCQLRSNSNSSLHPTILHLVSRLAKQLFDKSGCENSFDASVLTNTEESFISFPAKKRRRLSLGFESLLDEMNNVNKISDLWPWLDIIYAILINHPHLMKLGDYVSYLTFVCEKMKVCTVTGVTRYLCRCAIALLKVERCFVNSNEESSARKILWDTVWQVTISALGFNKFEDGRHELVQALLDHKRRGYNCGSSHLHQLFLLYTKKNIHFSYHSLVTLKKLLMVFSIPENSEMRKSLLNWILKDNSLRELSTVPVCAEILFACVIKSKLPFDNNLKEIEVNEYSEVEELYLRMAFEKPFCYKADPEEQEKETDITGSAIEDKVSSQEMIKLLGEQCLQVNLKNDDVSVFCCHILLLLKLATFPLARRRKLVDMGLDLIPHLSKVAEGNCTDELLHAISTISDVSRQLDPQIKYIFINKISPLKTLLVPLLEPLKSTINKSGNDGFYDGDDDDDDFKDLLHNDSQGQKGDSTSGVSDKTRLNLCQALLSMGKCLQTEEKISEFIKLIQICSSFPSHCEIGFQVRVMVLTEVLKEDLIEMQLVKEILFTFKNLCKEWYENYEKVKIILELLADFAIRVYKLGLKECCDHYLILVNAFATFVKNEKYGPSIIAKFIKLIGTIVEVDENCDWYVKLTGDSNQVPFIMHLLEFLGSPYSEVRMAAVEYIPGVFKTARASDKRVNVQCSAYKTLCKIIENLFVVDAHLPDDEIRDEGFNRTVCALSSLSAIVSVSSFLRTKTLYMIFSLVVTKKISKTLVQQALNQIVKNVQLNNSSIFLEQYLNCLLFMWYKDHTTFKEFPFTLLGCQSESSFYSKYKHHLVPILLQNNDITNFEFLKEQTNESDLSLVKECFPEVMACLLPMMSDPETAAKAQAMRTFVQQILGESMKSLLSSQIDLVLAAVYKKLHDKVYFSELCGDIPNLQYPEPSASYFNQQTITSVLKYLQKSSPNPRSQVLVFLCVEMPSRVQNLLHQLYLGVYEASTFELRLKSFHHYIAACDELGRCIADVEPMKAYIVRNVIHSLLNLITSVNELKPLSLRYLSRFISLCLPSCSNEIDNLLGYIVPTIVPVAKLSTQEGLVAVSLIESLFVNYEQLPSVTDLDPLPEDVDAFRPIMQKFRALVGQNNLRSTITRFIHAGQYTSTSFTCRLEGLKHLNKQLCERKKELEELYDQLGKIRGFSEECSTSILHQLTSSLIHLATCENIEIRQSAARCLGEIGPRDFTTLVLQPESAEEAPSLPSAVFRLLFTLLVDKNPYLAEASSKALKSLFCTQDGQHFAEGLAETEKKYLTPILLPVKDQKMLYSLEFDSKLLETSLATCWDPQEYWTNMEPAVQHSTWLNTLVTSILAAFSSHFLQLLVPICKKECSVSEKILPYLVETILRSEGPCKLIMLNSIRLFFSQHFQIAQTTISNSEENNGSSIYMNCSSVHVMLKVVNFVQQQNVYKNRMFVDELKLNYLHIVQAAQFCSAHFTSLFYSELWSDTILSDIVDDCVTGQMLCPLDFLCNQSTDENLILQNLLMDAYKAIGEPDAIYGWDNLHLGDTSRRIKYYHQMGLVDRVILECQFEQNNVVDNKELMNCLRRSGLYKILTKLSDSEYESAWRLRDWSLEFSETDECNKHSDYYQLLYGALRTCSNEDFMATDSIVKRARQIVVSSLKQMSLEVANNIYQPLSRLKALTEIELFVKGTGTEEMNSWGSNIEGLKAATAGRWLDWESILFQRGILLLEDKRNTDKKLCASSWLNCATIARMNSSYPIARWCLENVSKLNVNDTVKYLTRLEEAQLERQSGNFNRARLLLRTLLEQLESESESTKGIILSKSLLVYGKLLAEYKSESPHNITQKYLEKAAKAAGNDKTQRLQVADYLSQYAHSEYKRLTDYFNSVEYETKLRNMAQSRLNSKQLECQINKQGRKNISIDHQKAFKIYREQAQIDEDEMNNTKKELSAYLQLALREYLICLTYGEGDSNDLKVFRFVSLWLENQEHKGLVAQLDDNLNKVPSFKFLSVLQQLVVRISDGIYSQFMKKLTSIIVRCCEQHPHHSLPLILALANSDKDDEFLVRQGSSGVRPKGSRNTQSSDGEKILESRVKGARTLVAQLINKQQMGPLVKDMQQLSHAYISLANQPIAKNTTPGEYRIDDSQPIKKIRNMTNVACLTVQQPVIKTGVYNDIIGILKFEQKYLLVGGVNQPKKIKCICSDGISRSQLVKGKDDLRQDAVMQQVFTIMNTLLRNDENTAKRKLMIRTYKVVPLSRRSGVIEWCTNTEPLGSYLHGTVAHQFRDSAHKRYRPSDMLPQDARKKLQAVAGSSFSKKFEVYLDICKRLRPVFHYFFIERFPTPAVWFERRLSYIRSVATSSMIGYVLGIGDRHVANILLDQKTAEVIHIDFGIAFEQGKILPTPETVPFRLTRDIEDGMGLSGVEGVFRRSCEKTLEVLRKSQDPIVIALEVLLYDPLYTWTIYPFIQSQDLDDSFISDTTTNELKDGNCNDVNMLAERALQRLRQKLRGTEAGGSPTSIEGQVNMLIQEARDPANLCRLFCGWQAFL